MRLTTAPIQDSVLTYLDEFKPNTWVTPTEIAEATELTRQQVRGALTNLRIKRLILSSLDPPWLGKAPNGTWRSKAGYMATSRFAARQSPEVIWVHDVPIVGPFCRHCGNPQHVHGPVGECLNYRIHSVLPRGDLQRRVRS